MKKNKNNVEAIVIDSLIEKYKISREFATYLWAGSDTARECDESIEDVNDLIKDLSFEVSGDASSIKSVDSASDATIIATNILKMIGDQYNSDRLDTFDKLKQSNTSRVLNNDVVLQNFKKDNFKNAVQFFTTKFNPCEYDYLEDAGYYKEVE